MPIGLSDCAGFYGYGGHICTFLCAHGLPHWRAVQTPHFRAILRTNHGHTNHCIAYRCSIRGTNHRAPDPSTDQVAHVGTDCGTQCLATRDRGLWLQL